MTYVNAARSSIHVKPRDGTAHSVSRKLVRNEALSRYAVTNAIGDPSRLDVLSAAMWRIIMTQPRLEFTDGVLFDAADVKSKFDPTNFGFKPGFLGDQTSSTPAPEVEFAPSSAFRALRQYILAPASEVADFAATHLVYSILAITCERSTRPFHSRLQASILESSDPGAVRFNRHFATPMALLMLYDFGSAMQDQHAMMAIGDYHIEQATPQRSVDPKTYTQVIEGKEPLTDELMAAAVFEAYGNKWTGQLFHQAYAIIRTLSHIACDGDAMPVILHVD